MFYSKTFTSVRGSICNMETENGESLFSNILNLADSFSPTEKQYFHAFLKNSGSCDILSLVPDLIQIIIEHFHEIECDPQSIISANYFRCLETMLTSIGIKISGHNDVEFILHTEVGQHVCIALARILKGENFSLPDDISIQLTRQYHILSSLALKNLVFFIFCRTHSFLLNDIVSSWVRAFSLEPQLDFLMQQSVLQFVLKSDIITGAEYVWNISYNYSRL